MTARVPRVLHLLDPATCGDEGVLACAAAIRSLPHFAHHAWLIGSGTHERTCWSLGILTTDRIAPRAGGSLWRDGVIDGLSRLLAARRRSGEPHPDLIQCWSLDGLHIARRVFGSGAGSPARCAIIPHAPVAPPRSTASDADLATGREVVACFDALARLAVAPLLSRGGAREAARWLPTIRLLAPPAFAPGGPIAADRAALRTSLGIDPNDIVVGLLADPPSRGDALRITFAMGVLNAMGHRTVSLVRKGGTQDRRAAAYLRAHARRWGLHITDLSLFDLVAASDYCFLDHVPQPSSTPLLSSGPAAISLALSMAVPVISFPGVLPSWPIVAARTTSLGSISDPFREIMENRPLAVEHAAAVRGWGERLRSRGDFKATLGAIWAEQLNISSSALGPEYVR